MKKYIIEGGKKLEGTTYVSGSKNASLPIIASTILNGGINKLYNVPNIHDTQMMLKILLEKHCKKITLLIKYYRANIFFYLTMNEF